ncbi:MAG: hypothetical protein ACJ769_09390 [Chloroflexota bacterium]
MALDSSSQRSRRALLTAALAATAVTVAETVARPLSVAAADGDQFVLGAANTATAQTSLSGATAERAFDVVTEFGAEAIRGNADGGGVGVHGVSGDGIGVLGENLGVGTGVYGKGGDGNGVHGVSNDFSGVVGESSDGIGVSAWSSFGTALRVDGKAHFSRSGKATVTAGHLSVTVTVHGGLAGAPLCFANLRAYRSGVAVAAVRPNYPTAGKMRIYLTKAVSRSTSVAWLVTD